MATFTKRTPSTPTNNSTPSTPSNLRTSKRKAERSIEDVYNLILESLRHNQELRSTIEKFRNEISTLATKVEKMESSLKETNTRMMEIEQTANSGLEMAMQNRKIFGNMVRQSKLENQMEICGIPQADFDKHADVKQLAISVISSFHIQIHAEDIHNAVRKDIVIKKANGFSITKPILIVTFSDFSKKVQVLQKKKQLRDSRQIFFNVALSPLNGFLMRRARTITRGKNLRVHLWSESVCVKKVDGTDLIIYDERDLEEVQLYVDSLQTPTSDVLTSSPRT
jgi:exonuclease VII large subunit